MCLFGINSSKNYGKIKSISQIYFTLQRMSTHFWITPRILLEINSLDQFQSVT